MAEPNAEYTVVLNEQQHAFLGEIARKYNLSDESKALRCLINFAIESSSAHDEIFQKVRCRNC